MCSGKAAKTVAAELGVNVQSLMQWKQRLCPLPAVRDAVRALDAIEAENRRLRHQVESLVRQREILNKRWASSRPRAGAICTGEGNERRLLDPRAVRRIGGARSATTRGRGARLGGVRRPTQRCWASSWRRTSKAGRPTAARCVTRCLRERGHACGRHRIARLMRSAGLRQRWRRRCRISLTDSDHDLPVAPNRLMGQPPQCKADAVWVADITYVDTKEGWLYVAGVLDRHSRRCVGWAMDDTLATSLPLAALDMALTQRRPSQGLAHHSDRGVQYASNTYRQRLAAAGVRPSMSRRGNCYDKAPWRAFGAPSNANWSTAATSKPAPRPAAIFEWIEVFDNRVRRHSALGFQSPVDFENQLN
jgi:transposase InsO family protein